MRIQHNITAMNSYRNFSNNTSKLNKNLEKLASGYKINRAGDDAAGLAISEKMRAQISGLEGATKNAKDGISLIQTAEGALTEVHDMLNRMVTLAEQSANGTYQDELDRDQLQKEITNLKDEIDRVADSTNYNGIQLLNGDLDYAKETTVVADSAISNISSTDYSAKGTAGAFSVDNVVARPEANENQTNTVFKVDLSDVSMNGLVSGDKIELKIGETTITAEVPEAGLADTSALATRFKGSGGTKGTATEHVVGTNDATTDTTATWDSKYTPFTDGTYNATDNVYVKVDGHYYKMGVSGNELTFTQVDKMAENSDNIDPNFSVSIKVKGGNTATKYVGKFTDANNVERGQDPNWHVQDTVIGKAIGTSNQARAEVGIDFSKLKDGDQLIAGDKVFRFAIGKDSQYKDVADSAPTNYTINLSSIFKEEADLADAAKQADAMVEITNKMGAAYGAAGAAADKALWSVGNQGVEDNVGTLTFQSFGDWKGDTTTDATDDKYIAGDNTGDKVDLTTEAGVRAQFIGTSMEQAATTSFDLDVTKIKAGDTFTIDGKTFEFTDGAKGSDKNNVAVDLSTLGISSGFAASDRSAVMNKLKTVIEGNGTTIDPAIKNPNGQKKYSFTNNGDRVTLTSNEDASSTAFESRVAAEITTPSETTYGKGLVLQIGDTSDDYNTMSVSVADMHATALGIGDIDISTQDGASVALDKIKDAVNKVSDTRGNLGAMQNRLEHTINNLGVMRENVQNAESLIRDTDVAEEMMAYTKNNILNQSAQAMLAQANQLPQGVLQLLG